VSHLGESAAVHHAQTGLLDVGDEIKMCDDDHAVARTVGKLSVAGSDTSATRQEKEARSVGGIPFL
jgi:chaperonin cofactor prefoldin